MNSYLTYFIEVNLCLALTGVLYYLLFRSETNFKFLRGYILSALVLSVSLPLFNLNNPFLEPGSAPLIPSVEALLLPEVVVGDIPEDEVASKEITASYSLSNPFGIIYLLVAIAFFTLLLYKLFQIYSFYVVHKEKANNKQGVKLIPTEGQFPTFSFFNFLFYDNTLQLTPREMEKIFAHEKIHIRQYHSIDILLVEVFCILFWLNPMVWLLKKELQNIHEFLADAAVTDEKGVSEYSSLLAKMALGKMTFALGHHFNKSITLKRIQVMTTPKKKLKLWKAATIIPVVTIMIFAFSCNDEAMNDLKDVVDASTMSVAMPEKMKTKMAELQDQYPDAEFAYLETDMANEDKVKSLREIDTNTIAVIEVFKDKEDPTDKGRIGMIVKKNGVFKQISDASSDENGVFTVVEEPAQPEGGMGEFYKYIASNIKYPKQARKMGIQGRVYVQFVVNKQGNITDVKTLKGIGAGCNEEAENVIKNSDPWIPAKQRGKIVAQKVIIPISFNLGKDENSQSPASIVVDKVEPAGKMIVEINFENGMASGTVKSAAGKSLPGVNILVEGTNSGTVSNLTGQFKLKADEGATLLASFVGFKTVKIPLKTGEYKVIAE